MTVDAEKLIVDWCLEQDDLTDIVDRRIYTELPKDKTFPLVRFTLLDERPVFPRPRYLMTSMFQCDAYGGPKVLARGIADTICRMLATDIVGVHDLGVVTAVNFGGFAYDPDEQLKPAQPRYRFDFELFHHPSPTPAS